MTDAKTAKLGAVHAAPGEPGDVAYGFNGKPGAGIGYDDSMWGGTPNIVFELPDAGFGPGALVMVADSGGGVIAPRGGASVPMTLCSGTLSNSLQVHDDKVRVVVPVVELASGGPILTAYAGDPETQVDAVRGSLCLDSTGGRPYFKALADVGGDTTKGWKGVALMP